MRLSSEKMDFAPSVSAKVPDFRFNVVKSLIINILKFLREVWTSGPF